MKQARQNRKKASSEDDTGWIRPLLIVALLAAPALGQRALSYFSDDPYLLPLALTEQGLRDAGERVGGGTWIDVEVRWGREFDGILTQDRLAKSLDALLAYQTEHFFVTFTDTPGREIGVFFTVGANNYGPYPPAMLANGVQTSLIAFRMANDPHYRETVAGF